MDLGQFEWDPKKNSANRRKHGIDFSDAAGIFDGPCVEGPDERFANGESRFIVYGQMGPHVIVLVYCWKGDRRRVISARKATRSESNLYWEIVYGNTQ